jgi:hypothetical protein
MKDEPMGHVPYIHNNLPTKRSTETTMHRMVTDIQIGVENLEVTLELSWILRGLLTALQVT